MMQIEKEYGSIQIGNTNVQRSQEEPTLWAEFVRHFDCSSQKFQDYIDLIREASHLNSKYQKEVEKRNLMEKLNQSCDTKQSVIAFIKNATKDDLINEG